MNIEEKTKLAHGWYMKHGREIYNIDSDCENAWKYADAMEAEAENRIKAKAEKDIEESKVFFEELTKNKIDSCKHITISLDGTWCFDCGGKLNITNSSQLEWQPDWSVAPDNADEWSVERGGVDARWTCYDRGDKYYVPAPLFNYRGDWKDSLRKRQNRKPVPPTVETPPIKIIGGG